MFCRPQQSRCLGSAAVIIVMQLVVPPGVAAQDRTPGSERAFCAATGGVVAETRKPNVYVCCYPAKRKCLICDTDARHSIWVRPFYEHFSRNQMSVWRASQEITK